jgi:hypothetical protein
METDSRGIKILTTRDVADLLRVHRITGFRYPQLEQLSRYPTGKRRFFEESDALAFFENQMDQVPQKINPKG